MLLPQIADEYDANILILCEPYRERTARIWFMNETRTAVIWVRGAARLRIIDHGVGEDYVWVKIGVITYISVYLIPNCDAVKCKRKMALLEDGIKSLPRDDVVAKDFNARAIEWEMTQTNKRGRLLLEMTARLDLVVANTGNTATYRRPGFGNSIPDVMLTTDRK